jgi:hypothetical protein
VDPGSTATAVESALGPSGPAAVAVVAGGAVAALVGAYLLAFAYLRPAALAAFAASGRLRDGLNPRTVAGVAATGPYATGWTLGVGALAVGYAVAAPTVPLVVGVAVAFLARVVAHGLYGRGAADTLTGGTAAADAAGSAADTPRGSARTESRATRRADEDRGVGAAANVGHARDDEPARAVSGDGGQPMRSEPPARVQVGRDVPVDARSDAVRDDTTCEAGAGGAAEDFDADDSADDEGDPAADGDSPAGFEWGPSLADAEDKS